MSNQEDAFVRVLIRRFPSLHVVFDEHVDSMDELLPHVFFGDLTRYIVSLLEASHRGDKQKTVELRNILDLLEEHYAKNHDVQELISVSFLENLPRPGDKGSQLRSMLGPRLTSQLQLIG
jgi:hypothetical protein